MAKRIDKRLWNLPDFDNDISRSSSEEDSYTLHKNMQRTPNVTMPSFKNPLKGQKIFARKSPNVLRVRESTMVRGLGDCESMSPMNSISSSVASCENTLFQFSLTPGTSKYANESTKYTGDELNIRKTGKPTKDKSSIRKSNSYDNLSKHKPMKHINASVRAVTDSLENLKREMREQGRKNGSNIKDTTSTLNEIKKRITKEQSRNSLKKLLNKELHKTNNYDLTDIENINLSSESAAANGPNTSNDSSKYSRCPVRKTILTERQTQTTNSLEKGLMKKTAVPLPLKETKEVENQGLSVKRKIIEPAEMSKEGTKKSKTVLNQLTKKDKQNNENLFNKHTKTYTNACLLEMQKQNTQMREFESNNDLLTVDANVQNSSITKLNNAGMHDSGEDTTIETFLKDFDAKTNASLSAIMLNGNTYHSKKSLFNNNQNKADDRAGKVESVRKGKQSAHVPKKRNQTSNHQKLENDSYSKNSVSTVNIDQTENGSNKPTNGSKKGQTFKKVSETTASTTKSNDAEYSQESEAVVQKNKATRKSKKLPSKNKTNASSATENYSQDSETVVQTNKVTRKSRKPPSKNKTNASSDTENYNQDSETVEETKKNERSKRSKKKNSLNPITKKPDRLKDGGVLPQSIQITKSTKKKPASRTKSEIRKTVLLQPYFVDKLCGIYRMQRSNPVQNDENNCKESLKPKKSVVRKSKMELKKENKEHHPPGTTNNTSEALENNSDEVIRLNTKELNTTNSINESILQETKVTVDPIKNKSTNVKKNKSKTTSKNKTNQTSVDQTLASNKGIESIHPGISFTSTNTSTSDTTFKNKEGPIHDISTSIEKDHIQTPKNSLTSEIIESEMVSLLPKVVPTFKSSNKMNKNNVTKIRSNSNDLEIVNVESDSEVGTSLPKEVTIRKPCLYPTVFVQENISTGSSSAYSSEISNSFRGNSVKFPEPPTQTEHSPYTALANIKAGADIQTDSLDSANSNPTVAQTNNEIFSERLPDQQTVNKTESSIHTESNHHTVPQTLSSNSEIDVNTQIYSQTNDNSFIAPSSDEQNKTGDEANIIYTVVNNEVIPLNWINQTADDKTPVNGMKVVFQLRNLKSAFGFTSSGCITLDPKFQTPWHVSKIHCTTFVVQKGEAYVKVQRHEEVIGVGGFFYVPLGAEYTIINQKDEPLTLAFHKFSHQCL